MHPTVAGHRVMEGQAALGWLGTRTGVEPGADCNSIQKPLPWTFYTELDVSLLRKLCPHGRTQLSASARLSKLEDGAVHKFKSSKPPHSSRWLNITVKTTPTGPQMHTH